jgi:hypothetical protein
MCIEAHVLIELCEKKKKKQKKKKKKKKLPYKISSFSLGAAND